MFYSYKNNNKRWDMATTSSEKNAIKRERDILHIATTGGQRLRVSEATFKKAKRAYNLFRRLNRVNDRLLCLHNDEKRWDAWITKSYEKDAEAMEATLRTLLKPFKLTIQYDCWLASIVLIDKPSYAIGLNYAI